ncbi:hypothetical protein MKK69_22230 [Methylobacterium sp. J-026]|uniref:hypothetical protein n=1 Tax=Methylobacterium sp. J-026 TaxID=2836624 RepID=UPI001FB9C565|nr:hypothetical protein [Methylobacterium sp. J-026]MCJ2136732.1 hypothetical protein [Methylobacterium sp. J-026]
MAMPDLTIPLISAAVFIAVGWLIVHAGRDYADAIRHTLSIFALVFGLLVMIGVTAKLRGLLGVGRMTHRVEARSQVDPPSLRRRTGLDPAVCQHGAQPVDRTCSRFAEPGITTGKPVAVPK